MVVVPSVQKVPLNPASLNFVVTPVLHIHPHTRVTGGELPPWHGVYYALALLPLAGRAGGGGGGGGPFFNTTSSLRQA